MKKIGLAGCYNAKNFGSQLQLMANAKKIQELGCTVELVKYNKKITPGFILQTIPRLFNFRFLRSKLKVSPKKKAMRRDTDIAQKLTVRKKKFEQFAADNFPAFSAPYDGWENLVKQANQDYDGFVCGSDQLWLPNNLGSHFYTLEFATDDKPKIAYATSFGVSQIPWFQKKNTAKYLKRFQALSTRELAGSHIIETLTGRKAQVVCDPTLLFDMDEWKQLVPEKRVVDQPYVFAYLLGENISHRGVARQIAYQTGLELVTCPFLDGFFQPDYTFGDLQLFDVDAGDFVNLIRNAEFVLTDSFHGTVFSILHHKKFLTFNRFSEGVNSRNSRIDSLCELLDLKGRRYNGEASILFDDIAYDSVEEKLGSLRKESIQYLKNALQLVREVEK